MVFKKKNKGGPRSPSRGGPKRTKRQKTTHIRIADVATGAMLLDGLVGLDNISRLDFKACLSELKKSVEDPLKPGGLVDDCIEAATAYGVMEGVDRIATAVAGKKPGMTIGRYRITIG